MRIKFFIDTASIKYSLTEIENMIPWEREGLLNIY